MPNSASRSSIAASLAFMATLVLTSCAERTPTVPAGDQLSTRVVVSAPVAQSGAYVSMSPGSVAGGQNATIHNLASGQVLPVAMANGGFDPVPLAARIGDTVEVDVNTGTRLVHWFNLVPPTHPPTLVRAEPPPGKTDVPLNLTITVVFSEPIDQTTVTGSVQLFGGLGAVAGKAALDATGLVVTFAPDSALSPNASYTLVFTTGLRDLGGVPLAEPVRISFTTGAAIPVVPSNMLSDCPADASAAGTPFERVGSMASPRKGAATLLPDGRVLIYGGTSGSGLPQAEVYDPATRTFAAADQMMTSVGGHPAITLPGGKLLFVDGIVLQDGRVFFATPVNTDLQLQDAPLTQPNYAEIYDPTSATFTRLGDYGPIPVHWDTATLLLDGRVLLTGSVMSQPAFTNLTELFDPRTNTFKTTGAMVGEFDTTGWGTLLADGTVLFVEWCFDVCSDPVELFDPSTETFKVVGTINADLAYSRSVRLADGRVLITGGQVPGGNGANETLLYDPGSRTLILGPSMTCGRHEHSSTLLPDGSVLIAGGYSAWPGRTATAEIFHPSTR